MKIPPLKYPKKIPDTLFYHMKSGVEQQYDLFNLISLKNRQKNGFLVLQKAGINVENYYQGRALFVNYIVSSPIDNGYGQIMLDFAKNQAKKDGCNGHIVLKSDVSFMPNRIPHLFYRKNAFSSLDKNLDKKMDKFIKQGLPATHNDFRTLIMYYPSPTKYPDDFHKIPSLFDRIKNCLTKFVK